MGLSIVGGVVAYQVYAATVKTQTTPEEVTAIRSLDGAINQTTINSLSQRRVYSDTQMNLLLNAVPTPTVTIAETVPPEATPAATTQ